MSQTVKLGLSGSEQSLTPLSRRFQEAIEEISRTRRTASGKLKKQIIGYKRIFTLSYGVLDQSSFETLTGYYETHIADGDNLSLIYETGDGSLDTVEVSPSPPQYTTHSSRRHWLYRDFSMRLEEV